MRYHQEDDKLLGQEQRPVPPPGGQIYEISQAERGLMSDRMEFDIVCPNNHNQTVAFSRQDFEDALKSGALVFHCNTCEANWPPSTEEIARLRKQFSKNSS